MGGSVTTTLVADEKAAAQLPDQSGGKLRVLLVEDELADAELILRALRQSGFEATEDIAQTEERFTSLVRKNSYDVILADYKLPNWNGMESVELLRREGLDIPVILVSGALGELTAVECIKQGAADYVLKDQLARLHDLVGVFGSFAERIAVKHHLGAVRSGVLNLHEGCVTRHDYRGRDPQAVRVIGDRLPMIAGGHRAHAARALSRRQLQQPIEGTTLLERRSELKILELDVQLRARQFRQCARVQARGDWQLVGDARLRGAHILH